jgi:hypothetical protein
MVEIMGISRNGDDISHGMMDLGSHGNMIM